MSTVIISNRVWIPTDLLGSDVISLKDKLIVRPKSTSPHNQDPDPIVMYDDETRPGFIGIPREYYWKNRSGVFDSVYEVSEGTPYDFGDPIKLWPHQVEPVRTVVKQFKDGERLGGILQMAPGAGKCVDPSSLVLTDQGCFSAGDLVALLDRGEIKDVSVSTRRGFRRILAHYRFEGRDRVRIETQAGYDLCGTTEHPIVRIDPSNGSMEWTALSDVKPGDHVALKGWAKWGNGRIAGRPTQIPRHVRYRKVGHVGLPRGLDWPHAQLIGLLVGDGTVTYKEHVRLTAKDPDVVAFAKKRVAELGLKLVKTSNPIDWAVYSKDYRVWLSEIGLGYCTAGEKEIPVGVLRCGRNITAQFLRGLFEADAGVEGDVVAYATKSAKLAKQVQVVLLHLGVKSRRKRVSRGKYGIHWRVFIGGGNVKRFRFRVGFLCPTKSKKLDALVDKLDGIERNPNLHCLPVGQLIASIAIRARGELKDKYSGCKTTIGVDRLVSFLKDARRLKTVKKEDRLFISNLYKLKDESLVRHMVVDCVVSKEADTGDVVDFTVEGIHEYLSDGFVSHNTVSSLEIIRRLGVTTVILLHKEFLVNQWIERIEQYLPGTAVGRVQQDEIRYKGKGIVVCMVQSLASRQYAQAMYDHAGLVVVDEVHRAGAPTYAGVLPNFRPKWFLGLSATPRRKDRADKVFWWSLGPVVAKADAVMMQPKVKRIKTGIKLPTRVQDIGAGDAVVNRILSSNNKRNGQIVATLLKAVQADRKIIVFSGLRKHLLELSNGLKLLDSSVSFDFYVGAWYDKIALREGKEKFRKRTQEELKAAEKAQVLFATFSMAREGLDIPELDTVFLAMPQTDVEQAVGRILRYNEEKKDPVIVDFLDECTVRLKRMATSRLKLYQKLGALTIKYHK